MRYALSIAIGLAVGSILTPQRLTEPAVVHPQVIVVTERVPYIVRAHRPRFNRHPLYIKAQDVTPLPAMGKARE